MSSSRKTIPWASPNCGGILIHGQMDCDDHSVESDERVCVCQPKPNKDYFLQLSLAKHVSDKGLHIQEKDITSSWNKCAVSFCLLPEIKGFEPIQGQSLKKQFEQMVTAARLRQGQDGFDTHPDFTPFDDIMSNIIQDIDRFETEIKNKKDKVTKKFTVSLFTIVRFYSES